MFMPPSDLNRSIHISPNSVLRIVVGMAAGIVVLHSLSWLALESGWTKARLVHLLFDLRAEGNLSSYFAALLLLLNGILCLVSARIEEGSTTERHGWLVAGLVLLFLSADEAGQVHEKLNKSMRALVGEGYGGLLKFAWVVPYSLLLTGVAAYLLPWLRRLPGVTRKGVLIAGVVYVSGALLMELVESAQAHLDQDHVRVVVAYTVEETLELAGQLFFLRTVLLHLQGWPGALSIRFSS